MKIKKTKGTTLAGGPTTYEISTTCGETFEVVKQMHKWECSNQLYSSIKEIKDKIESNSMPVFTTEEELEEEAKTDQDMTPLYGGVCPACYWLVTRPNDLEPLAKIEIQMLDDVGLMTPEGEPDLTYAIKEVERAIRQLSEENVG